MVQVLSNLKNFKNFVVSMIVVMRWAVRDYYQNRQDISKVQKMLESLGPVREVRGWPQDGFYKPVKDVRPAQTVLLGAYATLEKNHLEAIEKRLQGLKNGIV